MINYLTSPCKWFFKLEAASGLVLLISAAIALILSNSNFSNLYFESLSSYLFIGINNFGMKLSVLHWINDALMAVFLEPQLLCWVPQCKDDHLQTRHSHHFKTTFHTCRCVHNHFRSPSLVHFVYFCHVANALASTKDTAQACQPQVRICIPWLCPWSLNIL